MKRKWTGIRVALSISAAICWWGILYPELTMTADTYAVVGECGTVQDDEDMIEWNSDNDIYQMLLESDGSKIRFRSKFFMQIEAWVKQRK